MWIPPHPNRLQFFEWPCVLLKFLLFLLSPQMTGFTIYNSGFFSQFASNCVVFIFVDKLDLDISSRDNLITRDAELFEKSSVLYVFTKVSEVKKQVKGLKCCLKKWL